MRTHVVVMGLVAVLLANGCATASRARAAEAMQCPEEELTEASDAQTDGEGAKMFAALLLLPAVAAVGGGVRAQPVFDAANKPERQWAGCGKTFACDRDGCGETAHSRALGLSQAVPALMEKSRQRLGPDATAERAGYFTWDLTSSRGATHCRTVTREVWWCTPDLESAVAQPVAAPSKGPLSPPPAPPQVDPPRAPLRSATP